MVKKLIILLLMTYLIPISYSKYTSTFTNEITLNNRVPTYTVKFNSSGGLGNMNDMVFNYGEIKTLSKNTYTNGRFIFDGWVLNDNIYTDEQEVSNLSTIDNDIVNLYATWLDYHVYFQAPPDWGNKISVYMYDDEGNNNSWPGELANLIDSEKGIYEYLVDKEYAKKYTHIIFSDIDNNRTLHQTIDLNFSSNDLGNIFVPTIYNELNKTRIYVVGDYYRLPIITLYSNENLIKQETINTKISGNGFEYIIDNSYDSFVINSRYISGNINIPLYSDYTYQVVTNNRYIVYKYYYDSISLDYDDYLDHDYEIWKNNEYLRFLERN